MSALDQVRGLLHAHFFCSHVGIGSSERRATLSSSVVMLLHRINVWLLTWRSQAMITFDIKCKICIYDVSRLNSVQYGTWVYSITGSCLDPARSPDTRIHTVVVPWSLCQLRISGRKLVVGSVARYPLSASGSRFFDRLPHPVFHPHPYLPTPLCHSICLAAKPETKICIQCSKPTKPVCLTTDITWSVQNN